MTRTQSPPSLPAESSLRQADPPLAQARQPALAALMSMLLPGLGQLYNGEANKAIWLFLVFAVWVVPGMAVIALYLPDVLMMPALAIGLLATLATWCWGMVDAWRVARSRPMPTWRAWQTSGLYALVFVVCNGLALPLLIGQVRGQLVESFRIPSRSMEPGVLMGDVLFADKRYNCPGCGRPVARGDIAIFTYPNDRTLRYIKRIIGLPGDRVQIRGREVIVNGVPLAVGSATRAGTAPQGSGTAPQGAGTAPPRASAAPQITTERLGMRQWQVMWSAAQPRTDDPAPAAADRDADPPPIDLIVAPGMVFVLADRRAGSVDSRHFGSVPLQDVIGRAHQVWFSRDGQGVRWHRLGLVLR